MDGHVPLQLFGVGPLRGLPSRYSFEGIEVVREIFGVAVAHLPTLGQTGLVLSQLSVLGLPSTRETEVEVVQQRRVKGCGKTTIYSNPTEQPHQGYQPVRDALPSRSSARWR